MFSLLIKFIQFIFLFSLFSVYTKVHAQENKEKVPKWFGNLYDTNFIEDSNPYSDQKWYERLRVTGYMQLRYNYSTNNKMLCEQCDPTYGGERGFVMRRLRIKLTGWVHPLVYIYIQPDFASDGKNLGQLRDGFFDLYTSFNKRSRFRIGQSKIMYGFDNMQSSQNRIPLDRSDPINSALKNERDLMVAYLYTPTEISQRFSDLKSKGLKGSGNYGMFALGMFNGQTANAFIPVNNSSFHTVIRFTYPFLLNNGQYLEAAIQSYGGRYQLTQVTEGVVSKDRFDENGNPQSALNDFFRDARVALSIIYYPQPIGFQTEFNIGTGPEYDAATNSIGNNHLHGGYFTVMGNFKINEKKIYPFMRFQYYKGGKKFELDARKYDMKEFEAGLEYSPFYNFELTLNYSYARRNYSDGVEPFNNENGSLIRLQLQANY